MQPRVLVIMATYNGERYLEEQIQSILNQEEVDVHLRINDDCSTDSTYMIAKSFAETDCRVSVHRNEQNIGVGMNFMQDFYNDNLNEFDYYAFSDQDDVWFYNKLQRACKALERFRDEPALYFCDIMNIDEHGVELGLEMSAYRNCEEYAGTPFVCNYVNGCAQVFNRKLVELISMYPKKDFGRLHDAWVMLIARTCGTVIPDFEYVGQYRRIHSGNVVGQSGNILKNLSDINKVLKGLKKPSKHNATRAASDLLYGYKEHLKSPWNSILFDFLHYKDCFTNRISIMRSRNYWLPTRQQRIIMKLRFLTGRY